MYASVEHLFHGNDLADVMSDQSNSAQSSAPENIQQFHMLAKLREVFLKNWNLARIAWFSLAQRIKMAFPVALEGGYTQEALRRVKRAFDKIDGLAEKYGFNWSIVIIPPLPDLASGGHVRTEKQIAAISPVPVVSLAPALAANPRRLFYPIDGHFNPLGAQKVTEFLLDDFAKRRAVVR
jgi:hypothetical protein